MFRRKRTVSVAPYPFSAGDKSFPQRQWYIAAWSQEVVSAPLMRKLLGHEIVLYRTAAGQVTAVSGLCPHRRMPLASAQIVDDQLICPYHGAAFDAEDRCASLPFQSKIPGAMRLKSFVVEERAPFIWIWGGDPASADMTCLPDTTSLTAPGGNMVLSGFGLKHVRARSQLLLENLFDKSHISFTHPVTLGIRTTSDGPQQSPEVIDRHNYLAFHHLSPMRAPDATMRAFFPDIGPFMRVEYRAELFGVGLVNAAGTECISCDGNGACLTVAGRMNFLHGITPETDRTTHYFMAVSRDFAPENEDYTALLGERNRLVADEDIKVLEAIEPYLDTADARDEPNFVTDAAAIRVRRRIEKLLRAEALVPLTDLPTPAETV